MEVAWAFTLFILGILLLLNLFAEYRIKELLMALAEDLHAVLAQLDKAKTEITDKITSLEGALASSGEQTQEVTEAVAALKLVSQGLDDVVADVIATEEAPVEEVPVEEVPVEEVPVEEAPAEEAPVEEAPPA